MKLSFILLLFCSYSLFAESVKKGDFTITDAGVNEAQVEEFSGYTIKKLELTPKDGKVTYKNDGKEVSWRVHVPSSYNPSKPAGVLVYINSGNGGGLPGKWKDLMGKHNLIWIGADNAGNDYYTYWRMVMAREGLRRLKETYEINDERVYVSGMSGGGRVSSLIAMRDPEVFKGAIYLCGCNTPKKDAKKMKIAKDNYYVLLTGSKDFNLPGTKSVYNYYQSNKIKNSKLVVVEGLGHSTPEKKEMDEALEYLNTPIIEKGKEAMAKAEEAEKRKRYEEAMEFYKKAAAFNVEEAISKGEAIQKEIDESYATARKAQEERDFVLALNTYDAIYKKFGKNIGAEAYKTMAELKKDKKVVLEIRAMIYYNKIAKAIKAGKSGDAVTTALKKVIESAPGSKAAELAEKDLKELGQ